LLADLRKARTDGTNGVTIDRVASEHLLAHAHQDHPQECCGLLMGSCAGGSRLVYRAIPAKNIAAANPRGSFQVDWPSLARAFRPPYGSRDMLVGFYHSHPRGGPEPSLKDRHWAWADYSYVIVGLGGGGKPVVKSWRVRASGTPFVPERLVVRPLPSRSFLSERWGQEDLEACLRSFFPSRARNKKLHEAFPGSEPLVSHTVNSRSQHENQRLAPFMQFIGKEAV